MNPNQAAKPTITYDKASLFIGLTSLPLQGNSHEFYQNHIENNFTSYKSQIREFHKNVFKDVEIELAFEHLYKPNAYFLFGEFDLAVISLIDDFSFATKKFHPMGDDTFKYQVNTGLIPLMQEANRNEHFDFTSYYANKIFPDKSILPIIGITSIKLNTAFIVGNGKEFTDAICCFLKYFLDKQKEKLAAQYNKQKEVDPHTEEYRYEFLIIESLGWNEITLVGFSNAFEFVQQVLQELRNNNWEDIKKYIEGDAFKYEKVDANAVENNALLWDWIKRAEKERDCLNAAHPFIATNTQFGYHIYYNPEDDKIARILDDEAIVVGNDKGKPAAYFQLMWNVKSGHDRAFMQTVRPHFGSKHSYFELVAGKNTVKFPRQSITFSEYFEKIHKYLVPENMGFEKITNHIYKMQTFFVKEMNADGFIEEEEVACRNRKEDKHYEIQKDLEALIFKHEDIKAFDSHLRNINVSKILKGQVVNMYHNFNEAIKDQLIFNNFIDLREALVFFREKYCKPEKALAEYWEEEDENVGNLPSLTGDEKEVDSTTIKYRTEQYTNEIKEFVDSWDIAFWNRYFHSYYFTEVNDFNLEHHGGIEMILSAYDSMYKIICEAIYKGKPYQFVRVTIDPAITSNASGNCLNFIHLFLPSLYAAIVVHEAANHILINHQFKVVLREEQRSMNYNNMEERDTATKQQQAFDEFINLMANGQEDNNNIYSRIAETLINSYDYDSDTEKAFIEQNLGANLIRYLVTDFVTYQLQYAYRGDLPVDDPKRQEEINKGIDKFMGFHLGYLAQNTELYRMNDLGSYYWSFDEFHFKGAYIRFMLMFRLLAGEKYSKPFAPFSVFEVLYTNYAAGIDRSVEKLVGVLEKEIRYIGLKASLEKYITAVEKEQQDKPFGQIINRNTKLMEHFYSAFYYNHSEKADNYKTSVLIRANKSVNEPGDAESNIVWERVENGSPVNYNDIVLDPKGGVFCININKRGELHQQNCQYMKDIWNIAQQWRKQLY